MEQYKPSKIEKKWQDKWEKSGIYKDYTKSKKFYALDMFPYPSGTGLHVGHPKGYIATDVVSRYKMLKGYSVLHPMGWDAFGLPAENYAIENKVHPKEAVDKNVVVFKKQLERMGFTYDWDREVNTTDPKYYKWTQWIFLKMFEKGLAYESNEPVNWCPKCKTVLANEDLENGLCERCGTQVVQRKMRQWVLKMTDYADRLLYDLDSEDLDWEDSIVQQQKNWIGRSEGAQFDMKIAGSNEKIEVYTTRVDTSFGMTYAIVAPEHPLIEKMKDKIENYKEVEKYIIAAQNKTELERTELQKEKTGVELKGIKVINPFNNEKISLFVADYVLGHYGTGAVMAVPAHDERDFEFAKKNNLDIKQSVAPSFMVTEGKDAVRDDKKTVKRKTVVVIIKHWKKNEIFCLNWEKFGWKSFIIGGVKDDESSENAVIREVKEESGYKDIKNVKKIGGETHSSFYAEHKGENRYAETECYVVELGGSEHIAPKDEDVKNHRGEWVPGGEVCSYINLNVHEWFCDIFEKGETAFVGNGVLINSGEFTGITSEKAREEMTKWLEKNKSGKKMVNYKMRDWVFSRQRYWGEPIPIIHCEKCGAVGVPEKDLPVELPEVESYEPTGTGESPLANIKDWVNTKCPKCGGPGKRETNTMPQWAGSSWYYLRYIDNKNSKSLIDKKKEKEWMPVDLYVGGAEHATRHLLYARFWHKFLYDIGVVSTKEPCKRFIYVGLIGAEDGRKMSKRWNNVINPDDVIKEFGADSLRLYEMFMGPFTQNIAWSTEGVKGVRGFLNKIFRYLELNIENFQKRSDGRIEQLLNKTIKKVTEDIENFRFNTSISQMMIFLNFLFKTQEELKKSKSEADRKKGEFTIGQSFMISKSDFEKFIILLSPFAPHICEEIWQEKLKHKESIFKEKWPEYDKKLIKDEEIELVVQVNGKLRDRIKVSADISEDEAKKVALESEKVNNFVKDKEPKKMIFVKGKLINIVTS
ncbi:leucine--tRNA ligase [bacterium BMS3Abin15]|nr:leucine--tRNA ligase [bacterium BMS3Abin15]